MLLRAIFYVIANAVVVFAVSKIFPILSLQSFSSALIFVLVLTLFNWTIVPVLKLLTFPISILTLGLFSFLINIFVVWFTIDIIDGIAINGDGSAKFGISLVLAVLLSLVTQIIEKD